MFSFFRKKNRETEEAHTLLPDPEDIPEWASFFTPLEYVTFLAGIENYFSGMNVSYTLEDGIIEVDPETFRFSKLGLSNVSQICKQASPADYAQIIDDYFTTMLNALEFDRTFDENIRDFEKVREYLGVRLYNAEYINYIGGLDSETVVEKNIADDVYAMLVFDLPDAIRNVQPELLSAWGMDEDALFDIGLANIREKYPMTITQEDMGGFNIWFANNDHFFTPNIVFELEDRPELLGEKGALVGMPHRHSVLIYPIEDLGVVEALQKLIPAVFGMHREGPGSLTPNLFWYHRGIFTHLPYEEREDRLHFSPPESFLALLDEMEQKAH